MPSTLAERLAARDAQRFAGRERELSFLESLFTDEPPAQVVLLHGPGGIGKSALLREIARRGAARGWQPRLVEGRELAPVPGELEKTLEGIEDDPRPLVLFDTYERMSAAGGWLRTRLLPTLPAEAIVVVAGRGTPEPEWSEGGWEQLAVPLELKPLDATAAHAVLAAHGIKNDDNDDVARRIVLWADGSPLALALAAQTVREGGEWRADEPNLAREMLRRLARTELDGGNRDVVAVAAIARSCDARMLRDVLPDVDPDEAHEWLRSRSFAEPMGGGVALHEMIRQAVRADLRATAPERERELRGRIAAHLHARALRGEPRLVVDLADLVENPALRWGFGADGSTTYRADLWRPEDTETAATLFQAKAGGRTWWDATKPILEQAPDRVVTVRDAADRLCGVAIAVTPQDAPPVAERDIALGPWLAHIRAALPGEEVVIWRDSVDFVGHGDLSSPVLAILNTAATLRSGLRNPRWTILPIDPLNEAAVTFAQALGTEHLEHLDVAVDGKVVECHLVDLGDGGLLGGVVAAVYGELGLPAPAPDTVQANAPVTPEVVRDALRNLHHPLDLAASPLARGDTPDARAASVRATIEDAVAHAFGESADEQLLRRVVERGYLDPAGGHEAAADELHVSRATYFRRLRAGAQRIADYLEVLGAGPPPP